MKDKGKGFEMRVVLEIVHDCERRDCCNKDIASKPMLLKKCFNE